MGAPLEMWNIYGTESPQLNVLRLNRATAMNTSPRNFLSCLLVALSELWLNAASPSTAFTYQGRLFDGGVPANGLYDLQFTNYDAANGGNALGSFNTNALPINNGLFALTLDFGAVFDGTPRWLEISERANGAAAFTTLAPRQLLAAAPYAMTAQTVQGTISDLQLPTTVARLNANQTFSGLNTFSGAVRLTGAGNVLAGSVSGDGSGLTNLNAAGLVGSLPGGVVEAGFPSGAMVVSSTAQDPSLLARGYVSFANFQPSSWVTSLAAGAPSPRSGQAAVWTGQELLIWGGNPGSGADFASGGRYRPDLDSWQPISSVMPPSARSGHSATWSGQEMIVWGGVSGGSYLGTGGRFNPVTQLWSRMNTTNAPAPRAGHVAVWTSGRLVVWGGRNASGVLGDGAVYDPVADQWSPLTLGNPPAPRCDATAVWTGSRAIVWGGQNELGGLNTGAQLVCDPNGLPQAWAALSSGSAPVGRANPAAVWTGRKMLVWGGVNAGAFVGDGAAYDPVADTWIPLAALNAPTARAQAAVVWTGVEMIVFGGETAVGAAADGAAYDPAADKWRPLSGGGGPLARSGASAAWTGAELALFAGSSNGTALGSLQRLNPQPAWYLYRKP